jgi:hypothetical protein
MTDTTSVDRVADAEMSLPLLVCSELLVPVDIVAVEQWGIAAKDGEDQVVLDPLMHGLSFDTKALAHIGDGEQADRPLFLKKAQQIGMEQGFISFHLGKSPVVLSVLTMHEEQKGYTLLWYTAKRDRREHPLCLMIGNC